MYENQEKTLILAKFAIKFHKKSLNHVKILYYQKWKKLALNQINAAFSEMLTDSENFNRCVENDFFIAQLVSLKIKSLLSGVQFSELFFY
jgi:late competence protein required for DNA uptake (superfamily II DNA/RNA helicase)